MALSLCIHSFGNRGVLRIDRSVLIVNLRISPSFPPTVTVTVTTIIIFFFFLAATLLISFVSSSFFVFFLFFFWICLGPSFLIFSKFPLLCRHQELPRGIKVQSLHILQSQRFDMVPLQRYILKVKASCGILPEI